MCERGGGRQEVANLLMFLRWALRVGSVFISRCDFVGRLTRVYV